MSQVEKETIAVEQVAWNEPKIRTFALGVLGRFLAKFGPSEVGYCNYLRNQFQKEMHLFTSNKDHPARVNWFKGLTFTFARLDDPLYSDEFNRIVDSDGEVRQFPLSKPLQDDFYFLVEVGRSQGKNTLKEVEMFFKDLKGEGKPIDQISQEPTSRESPYRGEVYAYLQPGTFATEITESSVRIHSPREWVKERMGESRQI